MSKINREGILETFFNFIADPEGMTLDEIKEELISYGVDPKELEKKVKELKNKYGLKSKDSR